MICVYGVCVCDMSVCVCGVCDLCVCDVCVMCVYGVCVRSVCMCVCDVCVWCVCVCGVCDMCCGRYGDLRLGVWETTKEGQKSPQARELLLPHGRQLGRNAQSFEGGEIGGM